MNRHTYIPAIPCLDPCQHYTYHTRCFLREATDSHSLRTTRARECVQDQTTSETTTPSGSTSQIQGSVVARRESVEATHKLSIDVREMRRQRLRRSCILRRIVTIVIPGSPKIILTTTCPNNRQKCTEGGMNRMTCKRIPRVSSQRRELKVGMYELSFKGLGTLHFTDSSEAPRFCAADAEYSPRPETACSRAATTFLADAACWST